MWYWEINSASARIQLWMFVCEKGGKIPMSEIALNISLNKVIDGNNYFAHFSSFLLF